MESLTYSASSNAFPPARGVGTVSYGQRRLISFPILASTWDPLSHLTGGGTPPRTSESRESLPSQALDDCAPYNISGNSSEQPSAKSGSNSPLSGPSYDEFIDNLFSPVGSIPAHPPHGDNIEELEAVSTLAQMSTLSPLPNALHLSHSPPVLDPSGGNMSWSVPERHPLSPSLPRRKYGSPMAEFHLGLPLGRTEPVLRLIAQPAPQMHSRQAGRLPSPERLPSPHAVYGGGNPVTYGHRPVIPAKRSRGLTPENPPDSRPSQRQRPRSPESASDSSTIVSDHAGASRPTEILHREVPQELLEKRVKQKRIVRAYRLREKEVWDTLCSIVEPTSQASTKREKIVKITEWVADSKAEQCRLQGIVDRQNMTLLQQQQEIEALKQTCRIQAQIICSE